MQPLEDGRTLREHLESAATSSRRRSPKLDPPPVPPCFDRQFTIWADLNSGRATGGFGIATLSWRDFHAYTAVTGECLSAVDLEVIRMIEGQYVAAVLAAQKRREGSGGDG